jgi:hypothetical protein
MSPRGARLIPAAGALDLVTHCPYNRARFALGPAFTAKPGAQVAQLVEHVTENHGVGGSIPPLGTRIQWVRRTPIRR